MLTLKDIAVRFAVTEKTIRRMVRDEEFPPPIWVGKQMRWPEETVDAWCRKAAQPTNPHSAAAQPGAGD